MNSIYIIFLVSIIGVGLVTYMAYRTYLYTQKKTQTYIENNEFQDKRETSKNNLLFFYADWCEHCQKSKPIWKNIQKDSQFKKFNLNFVDIDGEDERNSEILKKYTVEEYPTIILERDNKKIIFDADLETETMMKFLTSVYE